MPESRLEKIERVAPEPSEAFKRLLSQERPHPTSDLKSLDAQSQAAQKAEQEMIERLFGKFSISAGEDSARQAPLEKNATGH